MNNDPDPILWVWAAAAAVAAVFLMYAFAALADDCEEDCTGTRFVPYINGVEVMAGDLAEIDCWMLLDDLDFQIKPFSRLECIEEPIARTEI